ncbi:putative transcription factor B3-Domain family [Helianthus annuus]|nr:putative transcription factor B3-Domain family [Helianthus annuus]
MRAPLSKCEPAHFFKFIKEGSLFQQSIPESIRKYIKGRSSNETAVLKRGSQKWSVKVIDWVFGKGWDIFVKENGVQEYDIVVFKHEGNMVFDTMVFDPSFCEREYPNARVTISSRNCENDTNAPKKIPKEKDPVPDRIHHPYFIGTLNSKDAQYKLYVPINFVRANRLSTGGMILRYGQSETSWMAEIRIRANSYIIGGWHDFYIENGLKEGDQFKLELIQSGTKPVAIYYNLGTNESESPGKVKTPNFVRTLRGSSNAQVRLYIPKEFALQNGLTNGELILKDVKNEGGWTVNISNHLGRFYYIHTGLKEFCIANGLKKGDHVKFELIRSGKKPTAIVSSITFLLFGLN